MIHGILSSTRLWRRVRSELAKDHRLVLVDLPNHGYSERSDAYSMSVEDDAAVVEG